MGSRASIDQLRSLAPLRHLPETGIEDLAELLEVQPAAAGSVIFEEDTPGDSMFFLVDGQVRIEKRVEAQGSRELAMLSPGDTFGDMVLVEAAPRSARAVAVTDATLFCLNRQNFERWLGSDPQMAVGFLMGLLRVSARRLRNASEQIVLQHDLSHLTLRRFETETEFIRTALRLMFLHLDGDWSFAAYVHNEYEEELLRVGTEGPRGETLPATLPTGRTESHWWDEATFCAVLPCEGEAPLGFVVAHNADAMGPRERADFEVALTAAADLIACALQKIRHEIEERLRARLEKQRAYEEARY